MSPDRVLSPTRSADEGVFALLAILVEPDPLIVIDEQSRIVHLNGSAARLFGYQTADLHGEPLTMLMPERLRPRHRAAVAEFLSTGRRKLDWNGVTLPALHRDGREFPVLLSFRELRFNGRKHFIGTLKPQAAY
jgi:two-component system sensor kinase FixL